MVHHLREQEKKDEMRCWLVLVRERERKKYKTQERSCATALVDAVIWPTQTMH